MPVIDAIGFGLGAGLVAALNPCGFAFLPGYLGLVIANSGTEPSRNVALARAGGATVAMSAGFLSVFGIFGLLISPLIASAQKYLPFATVIAGVLLVMLALWLLAGKNVTVVLPEPSPGMPTGRLCFMYAYGGGYAIASMSCTIAPFLAAISITLNQGPPLAGVVAFIAYASGMTITVGVTVLAVALADSAAAGALRRILPHAGRIAGIILLLTGLYVTYYGYYEIRFYSTNASPDDQIVNAAGVVQGWMAREVATLGVWPLVGVLATITAIALGWRPVARRYADRS